MAGERVHVAAAAIAVERADDRRNRPFREIRLKSSAGAGRATSVRAGPAGSPDPALARQNAVKMCASMRSSSLKSFFIALRVVQLAEVERLALEDAATDAHVLHHAPVGVDLAVLESLCGP